MNKTSITPYQLFVLILITGLGSTSVLGVGMNAKQDAWISTLFGMFGGLILMAIYYYIFIQNPNLTFNRVLENLFGRVLGKFISVLYIAHYLIFAALVERDKGEMTTLFVLPETPIYISQLLALSVVAYAVYLGIEVIGRFVQLGVYIIILIWVSFIVLPIASGIVRFDHLLPILGNGWKPILKTAIPLTITFPYSELFAFTMIFPHVNQKKKVLGMSLLAVFSIGIILTLTTIVNITVLGPYLAEMTLFPSLTAIRMFDVGDALQRLDVLAVIVIMVSGGVKNAIYIYAITIALDDIFETKAYRRYIIPTIVAINFLSFVLSEDLSRHLRLGLWFVPYYLNIPFEIIFPSLIALYYLIRNFIVKRRSHTKQPTSYNY